MYENTLLLRPYFLTYLDTSPETWGSLRGCLIKGCLSSTEILKVGIPKSGIPTVGIPKSGISTVGIPKTGIPTVGIPKVGKTHTLALPKTEIPKLFFSR